MCDGRCVLEAHLAATSDAPGKGAMDRRGFISSSTLAAVIGVLYSSCGTGADILALRRSPGTAGMGNVNLVIDVAQFPALAQVGGVARVDGGGAAPVGAVRTAASQFAAYSLVCTHQGSTVNLVGSGWVCPNHGARFDSRGNVTLGPATLPLSALTATYDAAANRLTITGSTPIGGGGGGDHDGGRDD